MPIYEYECKSCKTRFEKLMGIRDPQPDCPECGSSESRRLISRSSFVLKGDGWYKDHYGLKKS